MSQESVEKKAPLEGAPETDDFVENILGILPKDTVSQVAVPSRGLFYNKARKESLVNVRPMTWEDEKTIALSERGGLDPMNYILSQCVTNVDVENILLIDKLHLIIKIREISYGAEYKAVAVCRRCSTDNNLLFDLSKLPFNSVPENLEDPREIELPKLKQKATVRFPRVADEQYLQNPKEAASQLWRFIDKLADTTDKSKIAKLLADKRFPLTDMHVLVGESSGKDFGIQTDAKFICDSCQFHNTIDLPLGQNFFSVN